MRHKWERAGYSKNLRGRTVLMLKCSKCGLGPFSQGAIKHGGWGFCPGSKREDGNSAGSSTVATEEAEQ